MAPDPPCPPNRQPKNPNLHRGNSGFVRHADHEAARRARREVARSRCRDCGGPKDNAGSRCEACRQLRRLPSGNYRTEWNGKDELELLRELCRRNFWLFFMVAFGAATNPKGKRWIDPAIHEPLAEWLQRHVDEWMSARADGVGVQKHLAIIIHREVGKTTLIPQALQLWLHLRDPDLSSFTGCESMGLSGIVLSAIKAVLDGSDPYSLFTQLFGSWSSAARSWTGRSIVHSARRNTSRKEPSLGTFAVETSLVGLHPDAIFYDDPISYERLETDHEWIKSVNSQVTSLIPVIQSDGLVVFSGTRYDEDDHLGTVFRTDGIATLSGMRSDALEPTDEGKWHVYFLRGRDTEDKTPEHPEGRPTTPKVWSERRLRDYKKSSVIRYASQVMNDPTISEHSQLTREAMRGMIVAVNDVPWSSLRYAITCDTAFWDGTQRAAEDETVFLVWGYPRGGSGDVYFIEGYGSHRWQAKEFGNRLVATVQRYRRQNRTVFCITDEVTMAGKKGSWRLSLTNFFNEVSEPMPTFHEFSRGGKKKETRLQAAASFWADGHVRIVEGAPGHERLIEQMSRIGQYSVNPRIKIDWADAAADAFEPQLYVPMRRPEKVRAPWDRGATPLDVEGLRMEDFADDDTAEWLAAHPRPPLQ